MQPIVTKAHSLLIRYKKTIAVAESCTGGLLSKLLTELPASSKYFILGIITYSNKAKETILKIPHKLIVENGAVSEEIAKRMANSARKLAKADFGVGITGIAGPGGGTLFKPVGTVFIALDSESKTICNKYVFPGNRAQVRSKAALKALELLNKLI